MTDKKIIIDDIDVNALNSDKIACMNRYEVARLFVKTVERLVAKEQENEELRQYHNKCCEENAKKLAEWLEKYNQISRDFHNGKYCNEENCNLLKAKEQECNKLYIQLKADEEYHKQEENALRKIIKNKEKRNTELYKENNKLKQTLIEIKEIIKQGVKIHDDIIVSKQILRKINECEVDNA